MVRISSEAIEASHIVAAIAEYDRLGRDAFMEQYRFGDARTVFLAYDGRTYEAKAIVGVANGYATGVFVTGGDDDYKADQARRVLRRLGFDVTAEPVRAEMRRAPEVTTVAAIPLEENAIEEFTVAPTTSQERERTEGRLVTAYAEFLRSLGHTVCRHRIVVADGVLLTDLYDATTRELVEAKSSVDRGVMKLALGQILDYARYVEHDSLAVLVPTRPSVEMGALLTSNGVGVIWQAEQGFDRAEARDAARRV